jgi:hypothetical protein
MDENNNKKSFKHSHISSWNKELSENIKEKEEKLLEVLGTINILEDTRTSKENDIISLEKTMETTLNNVEKYIEDYLTNTLKKFENIKNEKYENSKDRSNKLFSLYKQIYEDSCIFFSRKEFKYEQSTLKSEINDKLQNWFSYLFQEKEEEDCNKWTDVLTPIWSLEYQYIDMEVKGKDMINSYNITKKIFDEKKEIYKKINTELSIMKNELIALKDFSDKIKEFREDKQLNVTI